eukprot:m.148524 g.148524  ORF g.148524 m.148524 type:complete len:61 (+) comp14186_c0_seq1:472-654(+)
MCTLFFICNQHVSAFHVTASAIAGLCLCHCRSPAHVMTAKGSADFVRGHCTDAMITTLLI